MEFATISRPVNRYQLGTVGKGLPTYNCVANPATRLEFPRTNDLITPAPVSRNPRSPAASTPDSHPQTAGWQALADAVWIHPLIGTPEQPPSATANHLPRHQVGKPLPTLSGYTIHTGTFDPPAPLRTTSIPSPRTARTTLPAKPTTSPVIDTQRPSQTGRQRLDSVNDRRTGAPASGGAGLDPHHVAASMHIRGTCGERRPCNDALRACRAAA